jgi:hypothetical protein
MDYIVINEFSDREIIFSNKLLEYKLLWKGHKLSIANDQSALKSLIKMFEARNPKKEFSLDYKKWIQTFSMKEISYRDNCWNDISSYGLDKTYKDILEIMNTKFGYFNKLFIYEKTK